MKAVVAAFNQEKALVGAFSVILQPVVEPMDRFAALIISLQQRQGLKVVLCCDCAVWANVMLDVITTRWQHVALTHWSTLVTGYLVTHCYTHSQHRFDQGLGVWNVDH